MSPKTARTARAASLAGSTWRGLRVQRRIGGGGSSDVYLAVHERDPSHRLAFKVAVAPSAATTQLFRREARHLRALRHPGVARLRASGRLADGRAVLLSDFVDGLPLDEYAAGRPTADLLSLMCAIAAAMRHVHDAGIAHGDLKPANVLVRATGQPVIVDFGVARDLAVPSGATTGPAPLTPYYASPEALGGAARTARCDVHALGIVLRDLLHDASDRDSCEPWLRRACDRFVARCTDPDPARRYPHAGAMLRDLEHLRRYRRLPIHFPLRLAVARHGRRATAAAVVMVALGALGATTVERSLCADAARRESLSVSEFLVRLLDQASPDAGGVDVTLPAAWRLAEQSIATTFRDHPHGEARVRMAYGRASARIRQWRDAALHLQRAIDLLATDRAANAASIAWCERLLERCRAGS